LTRFL
jgi:clathrin heavy chain